MGAIHRWYRLEKAMGAIEGRGTWHKHYVIRLDGRESADNFLGVRIQPLPPPIRRPSPAQPAAMAPTSALYGSSPDVSRRILDDIEHQFSLDKDDLIRITSQFLEDFKLCLGEYNHPMAMMCARSIS